MPAATSKGVYGEDRPTKLLVDRKFDWQGTDIRRVGYR